MKNTSKIYLFIVSLFFMFSPFSLGMVEIYFEDTRLTDWSSGLIVNSVLLLILIIVLGILIKNNKLPVPNKTEIKFLIFGVLSNIIIYFYTFQNSLEIWRYVTIYSTILFILILYLFVIDRKKFNYELWIFAIFFFIVDFIHFTYIFIDHDGVGYLPAYIDATFLHRILYYTVPLATLIIFTLKIKGYKIMDWFAYVFIGLTILISLVFVQGIDIESKMILTFNLLIPFVIIIDIIVSLIYKRFKVYKIIFYIRMGTIIFLIFIYNGINYFVMETYSDHNLIELVMITYIVIVCNLIEFLIPKDNIEKKEAITS